MRDPTGLVERIPELATLTGVAGVARAIAGGNPHAVYRALWWAKRLGRVGEHAAAVDALLLDRRRFLRPEAQSPSLATVNGIGCRFMGASDANASDETCIATHFFVLVFIPVVPIAQYLVRRNGFNSWSVFGKVPLGPVVAGWQAVAVGLVVMGLLGIGRTAFDASRHATVHVVNGFDAPLRVTVGAEELVVPVRGHASVVVETGALALSARTRDGRVVDEASLTARPRRDLLLYDIAGAGPVLMRTVTYGKSDPYDAGTEASLCGAQTRDLDGINDVFTEPPGSVDLPSGQKSARRRVASLEDGGWQTCVQRLAIKGDDAGVARIARLAVDLAPAMSYQDLGVAAAAIADAEGDDAARAWSQDLVTAMPSDVTRQRVFQDLRRGTPEFDAMVATYRELRDANPESADAAYLHARLLDGEPVLLESLRILALHPDHALTVRLAGRQLFEARRFAEAAPILARAIELDEAMAGDLRESLVDSLAAGGQFEEALSRLPPPAQATFEEGLRAERLHRRLGRRGRIDWPRANRAGSADQRAWDAALWRARLGDSISTTDVSAMKWRPARESIEIISALGPAPEVAVGKLRKSDAETVELLDLSTRMLLAGELLRLGDDAMLERLAHPGGQADQGFDAVVRFIREGEDEAFDSFGLDARAAAAFSRSRMPGLSTAERTRWVEEARRSDVYQGLVTLALDSWPAPS